MDYEKDLQIDGQALDLEWLDQPRRFMKYSWELADSRDRMERAKESLDVERAEADKRARAALALADKKVTESMVNAEVLTDPKYQQAADKMLKLKYEVDLLTAAVRAFDQRKDALENLVRLHGQNYFAGPMVPHDIGREFVRKAGERGREQAREQTAARTGRTRTS